jgi:hypothetical protein
MKLKFVSIMAAFTLTALSLTGLTIPALCAQEKPATLPLIKVDHNRSTIGFAIPILGHPRGPLQSHWKVQRL